LHAIISLMTVRALAPRDLKASKLTYMVDVLGIALRFLSDS
jgi:hypothetical protein